LRFLACFLSFAIALYALLFHDAYWRGPSSRYKQHSAIQALRKLGSALYAVAFAAATLGRLQVGASNGTTRGQDVYCASKRAIKHRIANLYGFCGARAQEEQRRRLRYESVPPRDPGEFFHWWYRGFLALARCGFLVATLRVSMRGGLNLV
jgi:hypothetical protein